MTTVTDHLAAPRPRALRRTRATPVVARRRRAIFAGGTLLLAAFAACKLAFGPTSPAWIAFLHEDGLVETSETIYLVVAAAFALAAAGRLRGAGEPSAALIYALTGVALLAIGMEEISWGQRLFGVASPEFFQKYNAQEELTIYNLGPVQVLLDYAYFALAAFGAFAWIIVPRAVRALLAPKRAARSQRLLRAALAAAAVLGAGGVLAALLMTPAHGVALGLLPADVVGAAGEAGQRHAARLHDCRLAAAVLGGALAAASLVLLLRWRGVWSFLALRLDRLERLLVPRWHLCVFFLPAVVYNALHITLPHLLDSPQGLAGFLVQPDEEVAEFMLYVGWMIFFCLRFHHIGPQPARRRR